MSKRTKYWVHTCDKETARFSSLRHALLFSVMISDRMPGLLIEVEGPDGLAGQYQGGKPTPEFEMHHRDGIFD